LVLGKLRDRRSRGGIKMQTLREAGARFKKIGDLIFDRRNYEIKHDKTGETLFSVDKLPYDRLDKDTIYFTVTYTPQDCVNQTGLPADSVGVKFTSVVRSRIDARHLKAIRIISTWTASHADSVTKIKVIGSVSGIIIYVIGNTGTNAGAVAKTGWVDKEWFYIEVEVTTASATAGATTDLTYAVVEFEYGIS